MRSKPKSKPETDATGTSRSKAPPHLALIRDAIRAKLMADPVLARALAATAPRPAVEGAMWADGTAHAGSVLFGVVHELCHGRGAVIR